MSVRLRETHISYHSRLARYSVLPQYRNHDHRRRLRVSYPANPLPMSYQRHVPTSLSNNSNISRHNSVASSDRFSQERSNRSQHSGKNEVIPKRPGSLYRISQPLRASCEDENLPRKSLTRSSSITRRKNSLKKRNTPQPHNEPGLFKMVLLNGSESENHHEADTTNHSLEHIEPNIVSGIRNAWKTLRSQLGMNAIEATCGTLNYTGIKSMTNGKTLESQTGTCTASPVVDGLSTVCSDVTGHRKSNEEVGNKECDNKYNHDVTLNSIQQDELKASTVHAQGNGLSPASATKHDSTCYEERTDAFDDNEARVADFHGQSQDPVEEYDIIIQENHTPTSPATAVQYSKNVQDRELTIQVTQTSPAQQNVSDTSVPVTSKPFSLNKIEDVSKSTNCPTQIEDSKVNDTTSDDTDRLPGPHSSNPNSSQAARSHARTRPFANSIHIEEIQFKNIGEIQISLGLKPANSRIRTKAGDPLSDANSNSKIKTTPYKQKDSWPECTPSKPCIDDNHKEYDKKPVLIRQSKEITIPNASTSELPGKAISGNDNENTSVTKLILNIKVNNRAEDVKNERSQHPVTSSPLPSATHQPFCNKDESLSPTGAKDDVPLLNLDKTDSHSSDSTKKKKDYYNSRLVNCSTTNKRSAGPSDPSQCDPRRISKMTGNLSPAEPVKPVDDQIRGGHTEASRSNWQRTTPRSRCTEPSRRDSGTQTIDPPENGELTESSRSNWQRTTPRSSSSEPSHRNSGTQTIDPPEKVGPIYNTYHNNVTIQSAKNATVNGSFENICGSGDNGIGRQESSPEEDDDDSVGNP